MALIQSNPDAEPELVPATGDYLNPATGHRAWFQQGDPLTPGYVPDDAPEITEDVDDARLRKAVEAETRVLEHAKQEAEAKAADAEKARQEARTLVEQLEEEKATETESLKARVAELEQELEKKTKPATEASGTEDDAAKAEAAGTPRARRRAAAAGDD